VSPEYPSRIANIVCRFATVVADRIAVLLVQDNFSVSLGAYLIKE